MRPIFAAPGNVVWKFGPLYPKANTIEMPKGAKILTVGWQSVGGTSSGLFVWALVNPTAPKEQRRVGVLPTGFETVPDDGFAYKYLGTAHNMDNGSVWHFFEAEDATKALLESILP